MKAVCLEDDALAVTKYELTKIDGTSCKVIYDVKNNSYTVK